MAINRIDWPALGRLDRRAIGWSALLASTILAGTPARAADATNAAAGATSLSEVIVTAEKRTENVQNVPMSIQVMDTKTLSQFNVNNFNDFVKFLPEVTFQTLAPSQTIIYIRGVSDGGNGNHSGPQPSVATYLDEQPTTTILGALDVHVYDIARVEVLEGPQGTLYGSSSEAGTVRYITNQPSTAGFAAGYDLQGNYVDHGNEGYVAEGFVNIPVTSNVAIRLVGFDERDAGYIDNVYGTRPFATSGVVINNAPFVKDDFNTVTSYGGRAALKWQVNDNWTITPTVMAQHMNAPGVYGFEPGVGDLEVNRFQPDVDTDKWVQAALTIQGKIGNFDLTYSGGYFNRSLDTLSDYTDYSIAYDQYYGSGVFWQGANGKPLPTPQEEIIGRDRFEKGSNELRIASPATDRFRFIAGLFQERQTHWIIQDYVIQNFAPQLSVPGWPGTIWLTDQNRIDRDEAAFGEASFDIIPQLTLTGGVRVYHYENTLVGFYGFSENYDELTGYGAGMGNMGQNCIAGDAFRNAPCVNLNKTVSATGETHKVNLSYKIDPDKLVYFTYSTGYRPGGVNRSGSFPPYTADSLTNFEIGWKTGWFDRSLYWNGAIYDEEFNKFQFAFLGPNSLTIIANAPSAQILGAETNIDWRATQQLTLSAGAAYNHAVLTSNFCGTNQATGEFIPTCTNEYAATNEGAVKGQQLPYTPLFKGNVTLRYTFPIMGWNGHVQASGLYQSMAFAALRTQDNASLGTMPGYATADFAVGAERNNLTVELFLKNAFDSRGEVNRYTPCTISVCAAAYPGTPPAVYVVPIQPLTVGLKVAQRF
jgi:outer membrane receptor protein involved in Fe transport